MKQAIHIFKKDARQFRPEIACVLALTTAFAVVWGSSETIGLPLFAAWWFLIARAIHAEAIPGDRQFWLTRPYDRKSLWGAKALFVLVFINLPILAAQAWLLYLRGLLTSSVPGLLWEQVLLTAVVILPAAALAAMTATMVQFALASLLLIASSDMVSRQDAGRSLGSVSWISDSAAIAALLLTGCTILSLQYVRRKTALSRVFAGCGAIVAAVAYLFVPWGPAFAIQSWLGARHRDPVTISLDENPRANPNLPKVWVPRDQVRVAVPLQVSGLDLSRMTEDLARVTLITSAGSSDAVSATIEPFRKGYYAVLLMDRALFDQLKSQPVRMKGALFLTVLGEPHTTTVTTGGGSVIVPGVGQCFGLVRADSMGSELLCWAPFRWPALLVSASVGPDGKASFDRHFSYSPFPAALALDPAVPKSVPTFGQTGTQVEILTRKPISHFRVDFEIPHVRLADYVLR